jgi:hypothetical protein
MGKWIVDAPSDGRARDQDEPSEAARERVQGVPPPPDGVFEFVVPAGLSEPQVKEHISRRYGVFCE